MNDEEVLANFTRVENYCISKDGKLTLHWIIMAVDIKGFHLLSIGAEKDHFVHEYLVH